LVCWTGHIPTKRSSLAKITTEGILKKLILNAKSSLMERFRGIIKPKIAVFGIESLMRCDNAFIGAMKKKKIIIPSHYASKKIRGVLAVVLPADGFLFPEISKTLMRIPSHCISHSRALIPGLKTLSFGDGINFYCRH